METAAGGTSSFDDIMKKRLVSPWDQQKARWAALQDMFGSTAAGADPVLEEARRRAVMEGTTP